MPACRIEVLLHRDVEPRRLRPRAVIGEVQRLLDGRVQIDRAVFARAGARMQQHVLDDAVRAPAVLGDLLQIALQRRGQIVDLGAQVVGDGEFVRRHRLVQLIQQIDRQIGEVVDEVERVLDLVRDAGGELAERGHLLRLHQPVLRAAQIGQRGLGGGARAAGFLEQPRVLDGEHGLSGEGLQQGGDGRREAVRRCAGGSPDRRRPCRRAAAARRARHGCPAASRPHRRPIGSCCTSSMCNGRAQHRAAAEMGFAEPDPPVAQRRHPLRRSCRRRTLGTNTCSASSNS